MKLNRDVLVLDIVKHQGVFFKLLDYIDNHDGSFEFPENLYLNYYNNVLCIDDDQNVSFHLSISSLIENGVFIHNDKNTGMITLERVIVDLLRFLDIKRKKELTHFDFENLRKQIVDIIHEIKITEPNSQVYRDAMSTFNGLMCRIHSKVKENVAGLTLQVESIAKDYKQYDAGSTDISVFDLYEKVTTLYTRYVLPCYEFINPDMNMARTKTFSKSVHDLIEYHSDIKLKKYNEANTIQFRKTAITSYYKNIASLVKKLEQYSNHLEQDRSSFLAIESAYSELMESIVPLRHGKQRHKFLMSDAKVFEKISSLDGLTRRKSKYSMKFNWNIEATKLQFKEYLFLTNEINLKERKKELKPLPSETSASEDRQILISKLLYRIKITNEIPDIHRFIYDELIKGLSDFNLSDVLFGLEVFLPKLSHEPIVQAFEKHRLEDGKYFLDYIVMNFNKVNCDV